MGKTTLFYIVRNPGVDQQRSLRFLLDTGASTQIRDFKGRTLSHELVKACSLPQNRDYALDHFEAVDQLGFFDLHAVDDTGNGLLHEVSLCPATSLSISTATLEIMKILVSRGLDLHQKNHAGRTPLHLLGASPTSSISWVGVYTPLDYAVEECKNINETDDNGNTGLHIAAVYEEVWCKKLLEAGADPTIPNHDKLTPLHIAARFGNSNIIGMLLRAIKEWHRDSPYAASAAVNAVAWTGCLSGDGEDRLTPLPYACQSGRPESVTLLLAAGADPNIGNLFMSCARLRKDEHGCGDDDGTALRNFDMTQPPIYGSRRQADDSEGNEAPGKGTLEGILDMLLAAGIDTKKLCEPHWSRLNPLREAASLNNYYAYKCLRRITGTVQLDGGSEYPTFEAAINGKMRLYEQKMAAMENGCDAMVRDSNWLKPEGVEFSIFHAIISSRQYHLIECMIRSECRFLGPDLQNLLLLMDHGHVSLFDQIAEAETRLRLHEGEWHAFEDSTKPGLHFASRDAEQSQKQKGRGWGQETEYELLPLAIQRERPNMEIVRLLVEKYKVDIDGLNGTQHRDSALHLAARGKHWWHCYQAIPYLLEAGANIEARNSYGQTPLHKALDKERHCGGIFYKDAARH